MVDSISKGEVTFLAKRICKINEVLHDACTLAEELCHNETLEEILSVKDETVLSELRQKVQKYADIESPANMAVNEYYLEKATEILSAVFYGD